MTADKHSSSELVEVLLQADEAIGAVPAGDSYSLYELLHCLSSRIAPTDAFYIALYCEADKALAFAYNFDQGVYDEPVTVPLGNGPTSWVIRHGSPFVLSEGNTATHNASIYFGNMEHMSQAAVHVPIRARIEGVPKRILGVLSVQSYQPHVYNDDTVQVLQWLADRAGARLQREREAAIVRHLIDAAEARATEKQSQLSVVAHEFVQMLKSIGGKAEALRPLLPPGDTTLRRTLDELCRECNRRQTEANQLPLRRAPLAGTTNNGSSGSNGSNPSEDKVVTARLSVCEREVLELLCQGTSNADIADKLCITKDAVKARLKTLYHKLEVKSRLQAVQACSQVATPQVATPPAKAAAAKTTRKGS